MLGGRQLAPICGINAAYSASCKCRPAVLGPQYVVVVTVMSPRLNFVESTTYMWPKNQLAAITIQLTPRVNCIDPPPIVLGRLISLSDKSVTCGACHRDTKCRDLSDREIRQTGWTASGTKPQHVGHYVAHVADSAAGISSRSAEVSSACSVLTPGVNTELAEDTYSVPDGCRPMGGMCRAAEYFGECGGYGGPVAATLCVAALWAAGPPH